jgi:hypothetical protein
VSLQQRSTRLKAEATHWILRCPTHKAPHRPTALCASALPRNPAGHRLSTPLSRPIRPPDDTDAQWAACVLPCQWEPALGDVSWAITEPQNGASFDHGGFDSTNMNGVAIERLYARLVGEVAFDVKFGEGYILEDCRWTRMRRGAMRRYAPSRYQC